MKKFSELFHLGGAVLMIILSTTSILAQVKQRVVVKSDLTRGDLMEAVAIQLGQNKVVHYDKISDFHGLHLFEFQSSIEMAELKALQLLPGIIQASWDYMLDNRSTPNDEFYEQQWGHRLTKIDEVWDFTTGGLDANGREIVIAILDDGVDIDHEDLKANIYINPDEIPNNNKDDDGNGYIDDFMGYNTDSNNGSHVSLNHGTSVCGIIGAEGNNGIGVAGVNWKVKILPITGVNMATEVIEAYEYIAKERALYNETNGAKGSFIVVSSYSGGKENEFGLEGIFKEWCDMYDTMGEQGVLSFGATSNSFFNVDQEGDIPSLCQSPYFISVTNLKRGGKLNTESGYGVENVDIAAPGDGIYTLATNDGFDKNFTGTSASTPMVAGVAGLLYTVDCVNIANLAVNNPKAAALFIRRMLLEGVTESAEMRNLYASGGYLNAKRALSKMVEQCDDLMIESEIGALRILSMIQDGNTLRVSFISPNSEEHLVRWSDPLGRIVGAKEFKPSPFGEKTVTIELPSQPIGALYFSLANGKYTTSKGYVFLE